jgi:hypothetical protein
MTGEAERWRDAAGPREQEEAAYGIRTSELLERLLRAHPAGEPWTLGERVAVLGDRAFGVLLLMFALPNLVPVPLPAMSTVLGVPLILLAGQMLIGLPRPRLPSRLARWRPERRHADHVVAGARGLLGRLERFVRPRWRFLADDRRVRHLLGAVCLALALVLALPIPLGNLLPALALSLIALGLLEKDGLVIAAGVALGAVGLLVVVASVLALAGSLPGVLRHVLS